MARHLQIEWQEDEATLKRWYLEAKDAQNRTKLQVLWQLRRGCTLAEVAEMVSKHHAPFRTGSPGIVEEVWQRCCNTVAEGTAVGEHT